MILFVLTFLMLILAVTNDIRSKKIKNIIPFSFMIIGIIINLINNDINLFYSLILNIIYFTVLFAIPRIINVTEFLGAGDIKIYMAISFLLGSKFSFYTFLNSLFIGSVLLTILNIKRIKEVFMNLYYFYILQDTDVVESMLKWEHANIFSPYILLGAIATFVHLVVFNISYLENILKF